MGKKTSKMMEILVMLKVSGKSVLYADLLRMGFARAHIENAILNAEQYGYTVEKTDCDNTNLTKLAVK